MPNIVTKKSTKREDKKERDRHGDVTLLQFYIIYFCFYRKTRPS